MKRFFKIALVAFIAAATFAGCQKPGTPQDDKNKESETIALNGIALNKSDAELEIGATETLTVTYDPSNATEKPEVEWSSSAPEVATVDKGVVTAVAAGEATITAKAGAFTATCKITVKAGEEPAPEAIIKIDGDMSDWAGIEGAVGTGGVNAAFKVFSDETNLYFYVKRTTERMSEVWAGNAYHYYAFDTDGDASNDVDLWGNKADILLVVYPYAGTADAPQFEIAKDGATMPEANSVANAVVKGVVTDSGVETEVSIPRADIVGLPATEFKVSYWSNKGGSEKLTVSLTL